MTRARAWSALSLGRWLVLGIGCLLVAGCGEATKNPAGAEIQTSKLRGLVTLYKQYENSHGGQLPGNEADFKAYLKTLPAAQLEAWKISDIDKAFVSERDNEPYVIQYGKQAAGGRLIASERNGKDGKRMVAHRTGQVELADEAQFQKLAPSKAK